MITYNYFGKEQKVYYEKMDNGLDVYIIPNHHVKRYYIEIVTRYGSDIKEFILPNQTEKFKIPLGTAHFLEHKKFDMEKEDAISYFTKDGLYVNAGTNYQYTKYYIGGIKRFRKNFDYFLTMMFTSHFKDCEVEREKGIIKEEIKMYDDEPEYILDDVVRKCLYKNVYQDKIAGTTKSIEEINADILNKCYNVFYQPSNMILIVSGNVNKNEVMNIIKNNESLRKRASNIPINYEEKKEEKAVVSEYQKIYADILSSKMEYCFKIDLSTLGKKSYFELCFYIKIIMSILFGDGSSFDEEISMNNLATSFYYDVSAYQNICTISFFSESEYADLIKEEIDKTLKNIHIEKEDFERIKNVLESIMIRSIDNIEYLASNISNTVLKNKKYIDKKELLDNIEYNELLEIIKELDFSNKTFILMLPKI